MKSNDWREMVWRKGEQVGKQGGHSKVDCFSVPPSEHPVERGKHYEEDVWAEKLPGLLYY